MMERLFWWSARLGRYWFHSRWAYLDLLIQIDERNGIDAESVERLCVDGFLRLDRVLRQVEQRGLIAPRTTSPSGREIRHFDLTGDGRLELERLRLVCGESDPFW
jgi:hypothetical protein